MGSSEPATVTLALFGLGRMGTIHLENLVKHPQVNLAYIVDEDLEKAGKAKLDYNLEGTKIVHKRNDAMIYEDPNVNGIIISTPTDTHEGLIMKAIAAGKGVLSEKPLTLTLESTITCYKEALKQNVPLLCAFNRRFDPQLRDLHSKRELIGQKQSIKTCSRDSPVPPLSYLKISGGIFHDCAVHDFDLMRWMIGEEPETIFSVAHAHNPEIANLDDADTVYIVLKFPSGVIGHIDLSRDSQYGYHQTCEIFGENGSLMSDNPLKSAVHFSGVNGMLHDVLHHSFKQRYSEAYIEEISHFVELLTGETKQCIIKASDTLRASFLAQAGEDSWRTGQVINLGKYFESLFKGYNLDSLDEK